MSIKLERINSELVKTISGILASETNDELMHTITITGAQVSKDLSFAKVYFTSLSDLSKEQPEESSEVITDADDSNLQEIESNKSTLNPK